MFWISGIKFLSSSHLFCKNTTHVPVDFCKCCAKCWFVLTLSITHSKTSCITTNWNDDQTTICYMLWQPSFSSHRCMNLEQSSTAYHIFSVTSRLLLSLEDIFLRTLYCCRAHEVTLSFMDTLIALTYLHNMCTDVLPSPFCNPGTSL